MTGTSQTGGHQVYYFLTLLMVEIGRQLTCWKRLFLQHMLANLVMMMMMMNIMIVWMIMIMVVMIMIIVVMVMKMIRMPVETILIIDIPMMLM